MEEKSDIIDAKPIEPLPNHQHEVTWSRHLLAGLLPGPMTPFTKSVIMSLLEEATQKAIKSVGIKLLPNTNFFADIYGRLYVNSTSLSNHLADWAPLYREIVPDANNARLEENVLQVGLMKCMALIFRSALHLNDLSDKVTQVSNILSSSQKRIPRSDLRGKSDAALYLLFEKAYSESAQPAASVLREANICSIFAHSTLRNVLNHFVNENAGAICNELLTGSENISLATDTWKLGRLAASIGDIPEKLLKANDWGEIESDMARIEGGELFLKRSRNFLDKYGDICCGCFELSRQRWHENPRELSVLINAIVGAGEALDPETKNQTAAVRAKESFRKFRKQAGILGRFLLRISINQTKKADALKEKCQNYMNHALGDIRSLVIEAGRRFKNRGEIAEENDVFFLTINEIKQVLALEKLPTSIGDLVEERREEFNNMSEMKRVPVVIPNPPKEHQEADRYAAEKFIFGIGVSAGSYTGPARVITDTTEILDLTVGEVVIMPEAYNTFAPVTAICGALVTETGGFLSEAASAARCFGVPCVTMAEGVCESIANGDIINVDGFEGKITVKMLPEDH